MDVGAWLGELGLEQYADSFADNHVDAETLAGLGNDDLKDIGVASVGHRKKLLAAIADLSADGDALPAAAKAPSPASQAERRQVTIMFVDLVGSTELSGRLDPEDLRDVMQRYQDAAAGAITHYGGHVAKFLGDGILAYFGWPRAHEDQAERAVHAGLDAAENQNERFWTAELHRLEGEVILARSAKNKTEAEASFRKAIEIARAQEAKSLELRAATSLALLWGENKKRAEAHELLAPVYGWFSEGFDTADLKAAKGLLAELS